MSDAEQTAFSLGYWLYAHHKQVRWVQLGVLGVVCVSIWGLNIGQGIQYLRNRSVDAEVQRSFLATDISFASLARPQELRVLTTDVVRHDETHVDVVSQIKNPNHVFASHRVVGQFTVGGVKQAPITFFSNVDETQYIPQLAVPTLSTTLPEVTFAVLSVDWFRIHDQPLEEKWLVSDMKYVPVVIGQTPTDLKRQVTCTVTNASAYDFKQVRVLVVLTDNFKVIGVASTLTDDFPSLEAKDYSFTWSQELSLSATPQIEFHVDRSTQNQIFSPGN